MENNEDMRAYIVIAEEVLVNASNIFKIIYGEIEDEYKTETVNNFEKALEKGAEFKEFGLTPLYLLEAETSKLYVTAAETFNKSKLN